MITTANAISEGIEELCDDLKETTGLKEQLLNGISKVKVGQIQLNRSLFYARQQLKELPSANGLPDKLRPIFSPGVTDHAKLQFIKTLSEHLVPKSPASKSLPKEKNSYISHAINSAVTLMFKQNENQPGFKQSISNKISELLLNKTNLNDVFNFLKNEIDKNPVNLQAYLPSTLENLDENQKLELIQLCSNRADDKRSLWIEAGAQLCFKDADTTDKDQLKGLTQLQTKIKNYKESYLGTIMAQEKATREIVEIVKNKILDAVPLENRKYMEDLFDSLELSEQRTFIKQLDEQISLKLAS